MTFAWLTGGQVAVLSALTAATIAAIFFLKVRHPTVVVPSLVIWRRVLEERRRDSLLERLRRLISLLIALAIGVLLSLAIGEPRRSAAVESRVALVIDNSASMLARMEDGRTRLERALADARAMVTRAGADARFQVADTTGALLTPPGLDASDTLRELERVVPAFTPPRLPGMEPGYTLLVISDGVQLKVPQQARAVRVFDRVRNAGITAFEVRAIPSNPSEYEAYLSVVNFSHAPAGIALTVGAPDRPRARRVLRLAADGQMQDIFPLAQFDAGLLEARLVVEGGDAFSLDDAAFAWLPRRERMKVALISPGSRALEQALAANPAVQLDVVTPTDFGPGVSADVYVFDRFAPTAPPRKPALLIRPPSTPWLAVDAEQAQASSLVVRDAAHPALNATSFADVHVKQSAAIRGGEVLATFSDGRTAIASGTADAPWIALGFGLEESNLGAQPVFPVLVANAMAALSGERQVTVRTPGVVELPLAGARIVDSEGREVPSRQVLRKTVFDAAGPGILYALHNQARIPVPIALANPRASDVGRSSIVEARDGEVVQRSSTGALWSVLAFVVWLLLVLEWFTWHRRITV